MQKKLWIQSAVKKKGALHKNLKIPKGEKIPKGVLQLAAKRKDKVGAEARLALTLEKMHHKKK